MVSERVDAVGERMYHDRVNVREAVAVDMEQRLQVVCGHVNAAHVQLVTLAAEALESEACAVAWW